ncbi:5-oxoprolinase subunit PxpB [Haliscomenobacter sp.]|uniref:5-oxoprolinase subunit PxpB n=1 Tax=Haliscomenobacter sp. TaxID=2717303 RepID=UPI0035935252
MQPKISPLGDQGLLLDWGGALDPVVHQQVRGCWQRLVALHLPGVLDLIPAYSSLAILWDPVFLLKNYPQQLPFELVKAWISPVLAEEVAEVTAAVSPRTVEVPVCFEPPYSLDLAELAAQKQLTPAVFIERFCARVYQVYLLGFLPGFAYMGTVAPELASPRRAVPRAVIPAGSVGIAGAQTGIYPLDSPGGWQVIGRTPWRMFLPEEEPPVRLRVGDEVRFYAIGGEEFFRLLDQE